MRKPLFRMFLAKETDTLYVEAFARARSPQTKRSLLKRYLQEPEACTNKSEFLQTAIDKVLSELSPSSHSKRTPDALKARIADVKTRLPDISHSKLCSKLDDIDEPVPARWSSELNRTWTFAFKDKKVRNRMKVYFSKIKPH